MENMEQMPAEEPGGPSQQELEAEMQVELANRIIPGQEEEPGSKLLQWSKQYSEDIDDSYAAHFRSVMDEDPDIIARYQEDPEGTLQELENKLGDKNIDREAA
jgi:hypothetical protein